MGSSGKKKTTMAKLARENRLRERRLNKQAKKDARKQASSDHLDMQELSGGELSDGEAPAPGHTEDALQAFRQVDPEPSDPRAKEVALSRLREAPDAELAVFEGKLRDDALAAGASEPEMREAQRGHLGHGA